MPGLVARTATAALVHWCKAERRIRRGTDRVSRALAGIVWGSSSPEERARVALALHDALEHPTTRAQQGLFEWEERWFGDALPQPPARILIGGAGSGREVLALLDRGYQVHAFEPAPRAFAALRSNVGRRAYVWRATYQDFVRASESTAPYDAVVLGWGSLACLVEDAERERLVRRLDHVCPSGPILASFGIGRAQHGLGRAGRVAVGLALGASLPEGVILAASGGFMRPVTRAAVERLAQIVGRRAIWFDGIGMGHVTWAR